MGTITSASITDGTGANGVNISSDTLSDATGTAAQTALGHIDSAIANVASIRGAIGAGINRLQSAVNVINNQIQNLTSAADTPSEVANLSRFTILNQSGISALAQANSAQQSVLNLLR